MHRALLPALAAERRARVEKDVAKAMDEVADHLRGKAA